MFRRLAKDIKVKNAILGINEMLDELDEIKNDFQDTQSISYLEIQNVNGFNTQTSSVVEGLRALKEAERQLHIANAHFLKNIK